MSYSFRDIYKKSSSSFKSAKIKYKIIFDDGNYNNRSYNDSNIDINTNIDINIWEISKNLWNIQYICIYVSCYKLGLTYFKHKIYEEYLWSISYYH